MTPLEIFLCGFGGSVALDVVSAAGVYNAKRIVVPERYKRIGFYVVRTLLAVVAGGLAVAYEIDKAILAVNVGAATPLIIQAFSQGIGQISGPTASPAQGNVGAS